MNKCEKPGPKQKHPKDNYNVLSSFLKTDNKCRRCFKIPQNFSWWALSDNAKLSCSFVFVVPVMMLNKDYLSNN